MFSSIFHQVEDRMRQLVGLARKRSVGCLSVPAYWTDTVCSRAKSAADTYNQDDMEVKFIIHEQSLRRGYNLVALNIDRWWAIFFVELDRSGLVVTIANVRDQDRDDFTIRARYRLDYDERKILQNRQQCELELIHRFQQLKADTNTFPVIHPTEWLKAVVLSCAANKDAMATMAGVLKSVFHPAKICSDQNPAYIGAIGAARSRRAYECRHSDRVYRVAPGLRPLDMVLPTRLD